MIVTSPSATTRPSPPSKRRQPVVPPQHGAWGFLVLPLVLGAAVGGWSVDLVLLGLAWVAAYPASWAVSGLLTARRPERFRRAALVWSPVALVAGAPLLPSHPWLVWVLAAYLLLFVVNLAMARAGRERSLTNDLVLIAECATLVPVIAGLAADAGGWRAPRTAMTSGSVLLAAALCALTLVGSTLHVKSLIRERRNPVYTHAARTFAFGCVPLVAGLALAAGEPWWLALPFAALAIRSLFCHNPSWRPGRIGMIELAGFVLVALTALVAF